jgi:hypothetical protein
MVPWRIVPVRVVSLASGLMLGLKFADCREIGEGGRRNVKTRDH